MKTLQILLVGTMFIFSSNLTFAREKGVDYAEVLVEARKAEDGSQHAVFYLEDEIKLNKTSFKALKSSKEEFTKLKQTACLKTLSRLNKEATDELVALNKILELENNLLECQMTYEQAGINQTEIEKLEKLSYKILAEEAFFEYKSTKNPVNLAQFRRFLVWGGLNTKDLNLSNDDLSILAQIK